MGNLRVLVFLLGVYHVLGAGNVDLNDFCLGRGSGTYQHPWECSEYVICNGAGPIVQICPSGLLFDSVNSICDFPYKVTCGVTGSPSDPNPDPVNILTRAPEVYVPTTILTHVPSASKPRMLDTVHSEVPDPAQAQIVFSGVSDSDAACVSDGYYSDRNDCSHYILCVRGQRYRRMCPTGTYYNPASNSCGYDPEACLNPPTSRATTIRSPYSTVPNVHTVRPRPSVVTTQPRSRLPAMMSSREQWSIIERALQSALDEARDMTATRLNAEAALALRHLSVQTSFSPVSGFLGSTAYVKQISIPASQQLGALRVVKDRYVLSKAEIQKLINRFETLLQANPMSAGPDMEDPTPIMGVCPYPRNTANNFCNDDAPYRTADGTCNNLQRPLWGKSFRPFQRFIEPDYSDGISDPRLNREGRALPSARLVSSSMLEDRNRPSHVHTLFLMTFGQFIDHDLTRTAVTMLNTDAKDMMVPMLMIRRSYRLFINMGTPIPGEGDKVEVMCGADGCQTSGAENEACFPIPIPPNDRVFKNKSCLMFVRTEGVLKDNCELGPREQLNQLTAYLDASQIYGSSLEEMRKLRDNSDPSRGRLLLRPNADPGLRPMLPEGDSEELGEECEDETPQLRCFTAGDKRVNEQVGLTALHHNFHRYHNILEARLHELNPFWGGERLFQETRRIMGALWQHMIYNEFLPVVLGRQSLRQFGLELQKNGFYNAYDPSVNVEVSNAFATAAFRFAHSMIDNLVSFASPAFTDEQFRELSSVLRRPYDLYNNAESPAKSGVDSVIMGQISHPSQTVDRFFSDQITNRLFSEDPPNKPGMDLPALNIQRGREHGIPGYNDWREWCGVGRAQSFDDLREMSADSIAKFKSVYEHVDDIDLFPGAIAERLVTGGAMGPTFACIIGRQFRNSRVGDRFWYERSDPVTGFTIEQLNEIRKITVARVLCDTSDNMKIIQKYVMLQPISVAMENLRANNIQEVYNLAGLYKGENNERRRCDEIADIDLSVFKEE